MQKDVRPTQFFPHSHSELNEADERSAMDDNFDEEAALVKPFKLIQNCQPMDKMDNSLDNSNIQTEGEIGSSPQKIHKVHHAS